MGNRELFPEKSPKELLDEFRVSGANAPFEEIVRRYAAMVFGVCLRVTGDKHDAEDATQAVFLSLALQAKTSREIKYVGPWLQKVAHRLALDVKKAKTRRKRREDKLADEARHNGNGRHGHTNGGAFAGGNGHHINPADHPGTEELKQIMMEELNQLPAKYRMPLVMHYFGGLSREEMSEQLKCNPSTLGVRVHRGKAMLGTRLAKRGISISAIALAVVLEHVIREGATMPIIGSASAACGFATGNGVGVMLASAKVSMLIRTATRAIWFAKTKYAVIAVLMMGWGAVATGSASAVVEQIKQHLPSLDVRQWIKPLFRTIMPSPRADATDDDPLAPLQFAAEMPEPKIHIDIEKALGPAPCEVASAVRSAPPPLRSTQSSPVPEQSTEPKLNELAAAILEPPALPPPVRKETQEATDSIGSDGAAESDDEAIAAAPAVRRTANLFVGAGGGGGVGGKPDVYTLPANASLHSQSQTIGDDASGLFRQLGGTNRVEGTLTLGNRKGSLGRYELVAGTVESKEQIVGNEGSGEFIQMDGVNVVKDSMIIGLAGDGKYEQHGGVTKVLSTDPTLAAVRSTADPTTGGLTMALRPGATASYHLDAGELNATPQNIGVGGTATIVQTGGKNITETIVLAADNASSGSYKLDGGTVQLQSFSDAPVALADSADPQIRIGNKGTAQFSLGNSSTTGTIIENGKPASVVVRGRPSADGSLVGWGEVALTGSLTNNSQVVADGHRQQRTLDLTHFSAITNTIENSPDNGTSGWFARRKGKLALPPIPVRAGDGTYTWGEDPNDPVIDLVNSVRFDVDNAVQAGDVSIELLSPLRDDIPTLPAGHKFIGIWSFDGSELGGFDGVDLLVRYDDAMAAELGLSESALKLWRYENDLGQWERINDDSFWRDTMSHLISGRASALDYFAVSAPEPGSALLVIVGTAALMKRRRRRG